jgi:hypothetical protein
MQRRCHRDSHQSGRQIENYGQQNLNDTNSKIHRGIELVRLRGSLIDPSGQP